MTTRRAFALSFLDRYAGLVIHTASSMVVARLLTPSEIGVYSVTMVLLGFIATFRDMGAGQYMVQSKALTPEKMRATWTVQLALGWLLGLIVLAGAAPAAAFYREPQMFDIMLVLALNFAVTPFLAYPNAWLVREMRFGTLAAVRFTGALVHAGSAIAIAWVGWGPISLALANLMTTLASIVAIWLIARPSLPWRPIRQGIGELVSFGGKITTTSLLDTLAGGAPELLLGKLQGMTEAGLFSRGQGLVAMFQRMVMDAVNSVSLPYYARQSREARKLDEPFLMAMELITGLGWSFFFVVALMAYPSIRLLYGAQWDDAVDPARWLALACACSIPALICPSPLVAIGAVNDVLKATLLATLGTLTAAAMGTSLGLITLSQCLIGSALLASTIWLVTLRRHIPFELGALLQVWGRSLLVALGASLASAGIVWHWGWRPEDRFLALGLAALGGTAGGLLMARLAGHRLWLEISRALDARLGRG